MFIQRLAFSTKKSSQLLLSRRQLSTSTISSWNAPTEQQAGISRNALPLLRQLLRECSYLPDPASRVYLKSWIIHRYRAYPHGKYIKPVCPSRLTRLLVEARQGLGQLRKANAGYVKPLLKIMFMAYGRTGRRRQDLLKSLKHVVGNTPGHDGHVDIIAKALAVQRMTLDDSRRVPHLTWEMEKVLQAQQKSKVWRGKPLRSLKLVIPEMDVWERPISNRRVKNMARMWYAKVLDKVLPPLPEKEWLALADLASGLEKPLNTLKRRPPGTNISSRGDEAFIIDNLDQELGFLPRATIDGSDRPHHITPRFMMRLYMQIFKLCPLLKWDEGTKQWHVRWSTRPTQFTVHPDAKNQDTSSTPVENHLLTQILETQEMVEKSQNQSKSPKNAKK